MNRTAAKNEKGQVVIESSISLLFISTLFMTFLFLMYMIYLQFWTQHVLYETNICYLETYNKNLCIIDAQKKLSDALFINTSSIQVELSDLRYEVQSHAHYILNNKKIKITKKIKI